MHKENGFPDYSGRLTHEKGTKLAALLEAAAFFLNIR